jgi:hypothetical protein
MNMICCICAAIGSERPQNLCIITVTGTRNATRSHAPIFARYPRTTLRPPMSAKIPEAGTAREASGTPADAA